MTYALPIPLELMGLNLCGWKTSFNTMTRKCIKNQLRDTGLCKYVSCKKNGTEFDVIVEDDSS